MDSKRRWFALSVCIGFCLWQVAVAERIAETKCKVFIGKITDYSYGGNLMSNSEVQKFSSINCSTSVDLIVGGEEAGQNEFSHQALLGYPKQDAPNQIDFKCGGSLISEWYVLTAAHCGKPELVRLGEHNLNYDTDDHQDFEVEEFIQHSDYEASFSYHDIALVLLTQEVQFDDRVRPACLWTNINFTTSSVIATGFGRMSNDNNLMSAKLMKVKLNILDGEKCKHKFQYDMKLDKGFMHEQLCVGNQEGRGDKDTCDGDSGGPLQVAFDNETCVYHIVGITSFGGLRCGVGSAAAVYTRVASYLDWIEKNVWDEEDWASVSLVVD